MTDMRSLYDRLGGESGISSLVDEIVATHAANATIKARFLPTLEHPERLAVITQHKGEFLAMGSGRPARYSGKSMLDAHRGMNINETEYMAVVDDILGVLKQRAIDEQTQKDVLAIAYSLKGDILH